MTMRAGLTFAQKNGEPRVMRFPRFGCRSLLEDELQRQLNATRIVRLIAGDD